ncbi:MAG TPA: glycosyltransferase, partial [Prolixibacteraceae bacterium]|nr:glycosyltransferase [Prolixibacteraceae bacterium]
GEKLSAGWVGKNYACHHLAQRATGDYLLFLDADVRVSALFINYLVSFANRKKLTLLSVFPQQQLVTKGEWYTVPIMNWILLSFLPLPLVRMRWFPSLSAANGQVMFFETKSYREYLWHQMVKEVNVEDITIARMVKKKKLRLAVLLGNNDVSCRMYTEYNEAINGFARNMHQYFGGSRCWMFFFVLISWIRIPALFFLLSPWFALFAFVIELIMKGNVSYLSRQSVGKNYRFFFNQLLSLTKIAYRNIRNNNKGFIEWKGREYHIQ